MVPLPLPMLANARRRQKLTAKLRTIRLVQQRGTSMRGRSHPGTSYLEEERKSTKHGEGHAPEEIQKQPCGFDWLSFPVPDTAKGLPAYGGAGPDR